MKMIIGKKDLCEILNEIYGINVQEKDIHFRVSNSKDMHIEINKSAIG